jgi:hypothetical protein
MVNNVLSCQKHTSFYQNHNYIAEITLKNVQSTFNVFKSHPAYQNYTQACQIYNQRAAACWYLTKKRQNHTKRVEFLSNVTKSS